MPHIKRKAEVLFLLSDPELKLVWFTYGRTFSERVIDIISCERRNVNVLPQKEGRNNLPHLVAPNQGAFVGSGSYLVLTGNATGPSGVNSSRQTGVS